MINLDYFLDVFLMENSYRVWEHTLENHVDIDEDELKYRAEHFTARASSKFDGDKNRIINMLNEKLREPAVREILREYINDNSNYNYLYIVGDLAPGIAGHGYKRVGSEVIGPIYVTQYVITLKKSKNGMRLFIKSAYPNVDHRRALL